MKTKLYYQYLSAFLFFAITSAILQAATVELDDVLIAARRWIDANAIFQSELPDAEPITATRMTNANGAELPLWHVKLSPSGYLIMSSDDTLPPVVAFDTKASYSKSSPTPLPLMLDKQGEIFQAELVKPQTRGNQMAQENQARWNALLSRTRVNSITPSTIITPPMLTSEWDQKPAPYNYLCPLDETKRNRAAAGCVPVAIAQILKYHEWPPVGTGSKTYMDSTGDLKARMKADFSVPYNWSDMQDSYADRDKDTILDSDLPLARLIMELGVLVEANYEKSATGAYPHLIKDLLHKYLDYSNTAQFGSAIFGYTGYVNLDTLYYRLRTDMVAGRPALASYVQDEDAHMFVVDGLGIFYDYDFYHFNYGWGGSNNGWYHLTYGYEETIVCHATTYIMPNPVAVFKPISIEQASAFTLEWDFPKHISVEAFRLMKKNSGKSTVISSEIDGSQRSYRLTGQSGTNTYTLQAKINGVWQSSSDGIRITSQSIPFNAMPSLSFDSSLVSVEGSTSTTVVSSTYPLKKLTVTSSRPDILPDSAISTSQNGSTWTVALTPNSSSYGNILLYATGTDSVGNIIKTTNILKAKKTEPLSWQSNYEKVFQMANETGKIILLVEDDDSFSDDNDFCQLICERDDIKKYLQDNYVLWYASCHDDLYSSIFTYAFEGSRPFVAIIDPDHTNKCVRGASNPSASEFLDFINLDSVVFWLNDKKIYSLGITYPLELKCYQNNAVVHYRLDSSAPTTKDEIYTNPLSLTENTTISARAFVDEEAIGETVTKTYTFWSQVATPVLDKQTPKYFVGSCLLKATCDTPDATIRYTTDGSHPNAQSPVFPQDGLTITKSSSIVVKAFKSGMNDSEEIRCLMLQMTEIPDSDAVVIGENVKLYWYYKPWFLQSDTFYSSPSAIQSPPVDIGASTTMIAKVNGPGIIEFNCKTFCESSDNLILKIDGTTKSKIVGSYNWSPQSYMIFEDGDHYLEWTYSNDFSSYAYYGYYGCAWIDDINWKKIVSFVISGENMIGLDDSVKYFCMATCSDGTTSPVLPKWFLTSTEYASIDANGTVTNKNTSGTDQTVTLNAICSLDGETKIMSMDILLSPRVLQQVAMPSFNTSSAQFFTGNFVLKADCGTPDAVIRYTTNGDIPTTNSPIFPAEGLRVNESTTIMAKAFKNGMKSSEHSKCQLILVQSFPEVASGPDILFGFLDSPWALQTKTYKTSPSAMQSPKIDDNETTTMVAIVSGPGVISFNWKASGESNNGLAFAIDNVPQATISGNTNWSYQNYVISDDNTHFLMWRYYKNSSSSSYSDCGYVDDINWSRAEDITLESEFEYSIYKDEITITKFIGDQTDVFIPASIGGYPVVGIGDSAFENCVKIKSVSIPMGVTLIGNKAFAGCTNLEDVFLPNSLLKIDEKAFSIRNGKLKTVTIPASVRYIFDSPFEYCTNLVSIIVDEKNMSFVSQDGILYNKDMTRLIQYPAGKINPAYSILDSVKLIGAHAFSGCNHLQSVLIPEKVTSIISWSGPISFFPHYIFQDQELAFGKNVFDECLNFKQIIFQEAPTEIADVFFPTPITFLVPEDMGWEDVVPPEGVIVEFDLSKLTMKLSRGWQLCSLPFMPDDVSVALLKASGVCWGWINGRFKQLDNFLPGQGFWMYAPKACTLKLKGDDGDSIVLQKGWNLVGPTNNKPSFGDTTVWGMEGKQMFLVSPDDATNGLKRGKGYWIFVK